MYIVYQLTKEVEAGRAYSADSVSTKEVESGIADSVDSVSTKVVEYRSR